eukprot:TRINITY_DN20215_c1_g1_i1.p1 TRINITY_DN20215_c1_g1~~TRINITY_DN20215_c1_g1_i1.p1  ORF type:complete len:107 (+),score=12.53 TRINITY_DN20215_c1_g1_i1:466-786(+)
MGVGHGKCEPYVFPCKQNAYCRNAQMIKRECPMITHSGAMIERRICGTGVGSFWCLIERRICGIGLGSFWCLIERRICSIPAGWVMPLSNQHLRFFRTRGFLKLKS